MKPWSGDASAIRGSAWSTATLVIAEFPATVRASSQARASPSPGPAR
ncbi:hypothetical protein [Pseudonocardia sp. ICBG601]|nr:hypothetical protein [Pseudonocardia sp. ICBG601]